MPNQDVELLMRFLENHVSGINKNLSELKNTQESQHKEVIGIIQKAFPDGDFVGHNKFHQNLIDDAKARQELKKEIWKKVTTGIVWSAVVFLGYKLKDLSQGFIKWPQ